MSMYRKFKIKSSWVKNMFSRSNVDYCMADVISEGVNEYKIQYWITFGQNYVQKWSKMQYYMADVSSDEDNEDVQKIHDRGLICEKYVH